MNRPIFESSQLRERAEARLALKDLPGKDPMDPLRTVHELQVHQIELELQNEELISANQALDSLRLKYQSFYDEAPVGYLTLAGDGGIVEFNACAMRMLKRDPVAIAGVSMRLMFAPESQAAFDALLLSARDADLAVSADHLMIQRVPGVPIFVKAQARQRTDPATGEALVLLVMMDVTALKFAMDDVISIIPK